MQVVGEKESERDAITAAQTALGRVDTDSLEQSDAEIVEEMYMDLDNLSGKYG